MPVMPISFNYGGLVFFVGFKFWRVGSRKVYSVSESDLRPVGRTRRRSSRPADRDSDDPADDDGSSLDDFADAGPTRRRRRIAVESSAAADEILQELRGMREEFGTAAAHSNLPPWLRQQINATFQCNVCREVPMRPPVVFSTCCGQIIGCKQCVDASAAATQNRCPLCRQSIQSYVVRGGVDEFLEEARQHFADPDN